MSQSQYHQQYPPQPQPIRQGSGNGQMGAPNGYFPQQPSHAVGQPNYYSGGYPPKPPVKSPSAAGFPVRAGGPPANQNQGYNQPGQRIPPNTSQSGYNQPPSGYSQSSQGGGAGSYSNPPSQGYTPQNGPASHGYRGQPQQQTPNQDYPAPRRPHMQKSYSSQQQYQQPPAHSSQQQYQQPPSQQYQQSPPQSSQQYQQPPHQQQYRPQQPSQQRPPQRSQQSHPTHNGPIPGFMESGPGPYGRSYSASNASTIPQSKYPSQPDLTDAPRHKSNGPPVAPYASPYNSSSSSLPSPQRSASPNPNYAYTGQQPKQQQAMQQNIRQPGPTPQQRSYSTTAMPNEQYRTVYHSEPPYPVEDFYKEPPQPKQQPNLQLQVRPQLPPQPQTQPSSDPRRTNQNQPIDYGRPVGYLPSPTNSTFYQLQSGDGKPTNISTNKIPPASTVSVSPISPLAAEYRKELSDSPIQLYDNNVHTPSPPSGNDSASPYVPRALADTESPVASDDVLNMYLDESENVPTDYNEYNHGSSYPPVPPPHQANSQYQQPSTRMAPQRGVAVQPPSQLSPQSHHLSPQGSPPTQFQHRRSTSSQHSSGSSHSQTGSSKPPPVRQYSRTSVDPLNEVPPNEVPAVLTVEEFERVRKIAKLRQHDPKVQLEYAKKLVEAGQRLTGNYSDANTIAKSNSRIDAKTERRNREAWTSQAYKIVKKLASNPYADAVFYLASNYSSGGLGLDTDHDKAYELYVKAAKLEQSEAAYRVAVCNEIGAGTKRDPERAVNWYKKAAQMGDVSAMYKLGMINLNGLLGQSRSLMEAITWLQRAADKADTDSPHAVHELGLLYERADTLMADSNDLGTSSILLKDDHKAFELFVKAAKLGYPPSQFRLGCCYEYGTLNCPVDPKRSIAWYSRAAEKGEPESELALSGWYLTGSEGILQQSDTEAYLWARKAAEKGLAKAEYALGYFSEVGIGVKADRDEAKRWYFKAAAQKHPKALSKIQELR